MTTYTPKWFSGQVTTSATSAELVVPRIISLLHPRSVVDVGCGLGAWLAAFIKAGVSDIQGVDGDYVDRSMLAIPPEKFRAHDLTTPLRLDRTFDLAVSLEVAEHLPESAAETFVDSLTRLAPEGAIVFSAAVPGQGGNHHVNERWPSWWAAKFAARGFMPADALRPSVWAEHSVEWWYRQNTILYISAPRLAAPDGEPLRRLVEDTRSRPLDVVHPEMFEVARDAAEHPGRALVQKNMVGLKRLVKKLVPG